MSAMRDLKIVTVGSQRQNVSDVSGNSQQVMPRQTEKLIDAERSKR